MLPVDEIGVSAEYKKKSKFINILIVSSNK